MSPKVLTSGLLMRQGLKLVGMGAHSLTMNDSCKPFVSNSLGLASDPGMIPLFAGHLLK